MATSTVSNGEIPGVPSDASVLNRFRRRVQQGGIEKISASKPKVQTHFHTIVSSQHVVQIYEPISEVVTGNTEI